MDYTVHLDDGVPLLLQILILVHYILRGILLMNSLLSLQPERYPSQAVTTREGVTFSLPITCDRSTTGPQYTGGQWVTHQAARHVRSIPRITIKGIINLTITPTVLATISIPA
ncbi:hypothetical protein ACOMHN_052754 [Nucella lapillus]